MVKKSIVFIFAFLFSLAFTDVKAASASLDMFLWDANNLKKEKKELLKRKNENSLGVLVSRADSLLHQSNPTVTDKQMIPPSGDKRDYVSLGRYWWPNPNTSDGLPYVRRDGHSNPELNKFDRGRLGKMGSMVSILAKIYYITGDVRYAQKAGSVVKTWFLDEKTKMNPNMNFGQSIPGHNGGRGRAEGVIDTYSFISMIDGLLLLEHLKAIPASDMQQIRQWFSAYVEWMVTDPIGIAEQNAKNNHSVAYDVQLAVFASFCGKDTLAREVVEAFAQRRIFQQILPDGSQPLELKRTTAMGYSVFNINHMLDMCSVARRIGYDLYPVVSPDGRSIQGAIAFLLQYLGQPQEAFPYQQIKGWDGLQDGLRGLARRSLLYDSSKKFADIVK